MRKRHIPEIERLERRGTPDVSLGAVADLASLQGLHAIPARVDRSEAACLPLDDLGDAGLSAQAVERLFGSPVELEPFLRSAALAPLGQHAGADAWRFLANYTRKAIRNEELRF